jgi:RNA polymerase sigma-70 factor (ECF subfamily)
VGEPQAVEEVLQEIALAVVRGGASLADPSRFKPWLYQVAVRQTLLYRRKQGRQRKLIHNFAEKVPPGESDPRAADPLDWLVADERASLVRQAIGQLHRRDREILFLKYQHNLSYRELAARLGITEVAVEARLHRARKRLRRLLHHLMDDDANTE